MADACHLIELEPTEVAEALDRDEILLVDVREPAEFDAERIDGAVPFPLSSFDPVALPEADGKAIVFQCGSGMRSARAVEACLSLGVPAIRHMKGGIRAWKQSGLPTVS